MSFTSPVGKILKIELRTPFSYLQRLASTDLVTQGTECNAEDSNGRVVVGEKSGSILLRLGGPSRIRTCNQSVMSRLL
jgi:hypothetical protein